ncbi:zf-HC2 domain-containing protein [Lysinibacillus fusiformis]|uniref:zf-HC2 domain-containing protein n=1 Tax=Lysinibacillus fusiformis TaxID=28031 RepID=UPI0019673568|nr:zf-HC2 domain-containing protein [Lysinibacillus fusiformis]QSB09560.1 zf-HC2 domain-containing protein [Lysinibacillus fusiformis]
MKEIKCTIIQDILPLYIDGVVSQDTKEMVDQHLQHCEKCQKEYETMKRNLYIPAENKAPIIQKINKKWRKKKVIISFASIFATAIILLGAYLLIFYYERVIPYSKELFKIEMQNDNQLVSHYYGKSYATFHGTHPSPFEIDGEKKNVSFIFYTETIADSPSRSLTNNEKNLNEQDYIWKFDESEKIDAVYYVDYDVEKIVAGKDSWDSILERAVLIWEK